MFHPNNRQFYRPDPVSSGLSALGTSSSGPKFCSLEICAGAGGQSRGLELAGFKHVGAIEIDRSCCETLRLNRPDWPVFEQDVREFDARALRGIDLLAGGLPCPPFSVAGKQLGEKDERNLFPSAIRLVDETRPQAIMIENVRGFLSPAFSMYRDFICAEFAKLGYETRWRLFNACDFGVPQLRPRVVIVSLKHNIKDNFHWPEPLDVRPPTVGETLVDLMAANGWRGATAWAENARSVAPTLVGGSKKHGGPDLGPTRAKRAWQALGVDGMGIASDAPGPDFGGLPRLTVRMAARVQGFDDEWQFHGKKTATYRQVGNAFPPPVARAVASCIGQAIEVRKSHPVSAVRSHTFLGEARRSFHTALFDSGLLSTDANGIPSIADRSSSVSRRIAAAMVARLGAHVIAAKLAGQVSGNEFETIVGEFVHQSMTRLPTIRPGRFSVCKGKTRMAIASTEQYSHLASRVDLAKRYPEYAGAIGLDYMIRPDLMVLKDALDDAEINAVEHFVGNEVAKLTAIRASNGALPSLHASVSCKWTLRSDRAQNAKVEALNLIRHRNGRAPHIVVVTAEPMPDRLLSIVSGSGEIDCVYHIALPELRDSVSGVGLEDARATLEAMIQGKRLKDIADLPLDLAT